MRFRIQLFLAALATSLLTNAQGIYIEGGFGYGFPISSNTDMLYNYSSTSTNDLDNGEFSFSNNEEIVKLNLGKGFNFAAAFGYMFNDFIGAEVQVSYLAGGKTNAEEVYKDIVIQNGMSSSTTETYRTTYSSNMLRITPSLVVQGNLGKFNPYAKLGLLLGFGSATLQQDAILMGSNSVLEAKLNGGLSYGVNSRLGFLYSPGGSVSYFVEAQIIAMNYCPTKGEIMKYTVNGDDILGDLTTSEREVEFVDSTSSTDFFEDPNKPSQSLKMALPFSSIGVNVGVRFNLAR
jgi:hypothetical protein